MGLSTIKRADEMQYYKLKGRRVVKAKSQKDGQHSVLVALTKLPKNKDVSTVFLGGLSPMFETMVFRGSRGDDNPDRSTTWVSAENRHLDTVKKEMNRLR